MQTSSRCWLIWCVLLLASPAACADGPAPTPAAEAFQAIEKLIGDAPCESDADCRTVGIGAKSCGGPERYLPWSVRYTQPSELDKQVNRHREAKRAEAMRDGRMSNCAVTPVPSTSCVAGQCRLQASNPTR